MESTSKNSLSLRKKSPSTEESASSTGALGKRSQQSHTRAQRQDVLAAVARLGTVAEAAQVCQAPGFVEAFLVGN